MPRFPTRIMKTALAKGSHRKQWVTGLLRILVLVCFALANCGCEVSNDQQGTKEVSDAAQAVWPEGYESVRLTALSPDANLGVITYIKIPVGDREQTVYKRYIVDSLNLAKMSYRVVDSLEFDTHWEWMEFLNTHVLMYMSYRIGEGDEADVNRIVLHDFRGEKETVLLESLPTDSSTYWINNLQPCYDVYLPDSLIVYQERVGADIHFAGQRIPMRIVIRRVLPNGEVPIIGTIDDAEEPRFSEDGRQVLAERWTEEAKNYYSATVVVYDLESESVTELDLPLQFGRSARRLTKESPIFYLGAETQDWTSANIRFHHAQDGIETALTFLSPPLQIWHYYVIADSILYELADPTTDFPTDVRWVTVSLRR